MRPTKGVHLIVPRERVENRNAVGFTAPDRRLLFLIPWGRFTIIGTTDSDYDRDLDHVPVEADDVAYILDAFNRAFPRINLDESDVISTYAGVRPLVAEEILSTYRVSREHRIFETPSGLLAIAGGKLTTYRAMARQLVDVVEKRLGREFGVRASGNCVTDKLLLEGGPKKGIRVALVEEVADACQMHGLDREVAAHLLDSYGTGYNRVLALIEEDRALKEPIAPGLPYLRAEVPHAVQHEMALTLSDFMIRRTHLIYEDRNQGLDQAREVAELMARYLDWGPEETGRQVELYREQVALTRRYRRC